MMVDWPALKVAALESQSRAYAPYSNYRVGAAVLTQSGEIFGACNVENAFYGATCCAERAAAYMAVAAGYTVLTAVAVVTNGDAPGTPCGICRQVLAEFGGEMDVLCFTPEGAEKAYKLSELLPFAFTLE